jgi:hypothetical protein
MKGLNRSEESALREIAERHGYIAHSGPHAGKGSASELIGVLIKGELATVLLSDEQRAWFIDWLRSQQVDDPLYEDVPKLVADQLWTAVVRESSS